ncbi:MAG TPA: type II secretion system protein, partial [Rhodospirillales bacterium]
MRMRTSERGMSLIEATIILMVLAILTATLAPTLGDYVNDARQTKAKEDVEALGASVVRLLRDTGLPFVVRVVGAGAASTNRVDLLVTEGALPTAAAAMGTDAAAAGFLVQNDVRWDDAAGAEVELATDHLVTNANAYTTV